MSFHEIITDKLWLGPSIVATKTPQTLQSLGITHILNVCELKCLHPNLFTYYYINDLEDSSRQSIAIYFADVYNFIEDCLKNGGKIYCHCEAGRSRSASLVIFYLMKKEKLTFKQAFDLVKSKRNIINPNLGFIRELRNYEEMCE